MTTIAENIDNYIEKYNIVVVDDEKFICEIIKEILATEEKYNAVFFTVPESGILVADSREISTRG